MRADILEAGSQWMAKYRGTEDPKVLAQIVARVEELLEELGGYVSPSHFERAYLLLVNEKAIQPFRGSMQDKLAEGSAEIPQSVIDFIERTPARELQRRYNSGDATFRSQYDAYEKLKSPQQQAQSSSTLSVEQYRQLPAREVARRYQTDRGFKSSVDALISRGEI